MGKLWHLICGAVVVAGVAGCAAPAKYEITSLPKGEPLDIRNIIAANPGKYACMEYRAVTNSCASTLTFSVEGDVLVSREKAVLSPPAGGAPRDVELVSRSALSEGQACVQASDITVSGTDALSAQLLDATRRAITQAGGQVCARYFRAGHAYVVSRTGADGAPFPPGDASFQFIVREAALRAQ